MIAPDRAVGRINALRNDALDIHPVRMSQHRCPIDLKVLAVADRLCRTFCKEIPQHRLALKQRPPPQILPVKKQQIEREIAHARTCGCMHVLLELPVIAGAVLAQHGHFAVKHGMTDAQLRRLFGDGAITARPVMPVAAIDRDHIITLVEL